MVQDVFLIIQFNLLRGPKDRYRVGLLFERRNSRVTLVGSDLRDSGKVVEE